MGRLLLCWLAALFWLPATGFGAELEICTLSPLGGVAVGQGMRAKVHYQGRLSDGKVFDDSRERGKHPLFFMMKMVRLQPILVARWSNSSVLKTYLI